MMNDDDDDEFYCQLQFCFLAVPLVFLKNES